jgi:hypothetical protein
MYSQPEAASIHVSEPQLSIWQCVWCFQQFQRNAMPALLCGTALNVGTHVLVCLLYRVLGLWVVEMP